MAMHLESLDRKNEGSLGPDWSNFSTRVLEVITKGHCLELLPMTGIGRVAFELDGRPEVFPVNYARMGQDIVFMTGPGTKLSSALNATEVVFEVDHFDITFHTGWSIVVRGPSNEIADEHSLARARRLPLTPWAPGNRHHYVKISDEQISGRRIVPTDRQRSHHFSEVESTEIGG